MTQPKFGDLCWNGYWQEFYVELNTVNEGQRVSWWMGRIEGLGFSNAKPFDNVTVHRTPFNLSEKDRIVLTGEMIHSVYGDFDSYKEMFKVYRSLAEEAGGKLREELYGRKPQSRPTPY